MKKPDWTTNEKIIFYLKEFSDIYKKRPIKDNTGGMKSIHMFYIWFSAKTLNPQLIIDSGTFKGQSAWVLREACPKAKIISFDPSPKSRVFDTPNVEYFSHDFSEHDWSNCPEKSLVVFDDHQNAYTRLQQCKWFGFKNIIFDDNYPVLQGDCYSIKKILSGKGFRTEFIKRKNNLTFLEKIYRKFSNKLFKFPTQTEQFERIAIAENQQDKYFLKKNVIEYIEFPPIFKTEKTRWGDEWTNINYPTSEPLLGNISEEEIVLSKDFYKKECKSYNWICYLKLS